MTDVLDKRIREMEGELEKCRAQARAETDQRLKDLQAMHEDQQNEFIQEIESLKRAHAAELKKLQDE